MQYIIFTVELPQMWEKWVAQNYYKEFLSHLFFIQYIVSFFVVVSLSVEVFWMFYHVFLLHVCIDFSSRFTKIQFQFQHLFKFPFVCAYLTSDMLFRKMEGRNCAKFPSSGEKISNFSEEKKEHWILKLQTNLFSAISFFASSVRLTSNNQYAAHQLKGFPSSTILWIRL